MPSLTRWYLKTALLWFLAALALGVVDAGGASRTVIALRPVYFHLLTVGWITQMIFGVAFWMFPRYSRDRPRGSETLGWATYVALNVGLALRVLGEPLQARGATAATASMLLLSATLQWCAAALFVLNCWPRVRAK